MIHVTVEFVSGKVIKRKFNTRIDAELFLCNLKGKFVGYFDDGTFAVGKL